VKNLMVEISDKSGVRLEKVGFSGKTISIGRAWKSDVILQDKFVDPDHLSLTVGEGGMLLLADQTTTNGTVLAGRQLRGQGSVYRLGESIRVGDTRLSFFDQNASVAPTSIRSSWFLIADKFRSFPSLIVLTLITIALSVFSDWMFAKEPVDISSVLMISAGVFLGIVVWSLVLGFVSKLSRGESHFQALWVLACFAIVVIEIVSLSILLLRFNMQDLSQGTVVSNVVFVALAIWVLVGVFTYTSHVSARYKWLWSSLIVLTIYGVSKSDDFMQKEHEKWSASTRTEGVTLPPVFLWRDRVSVDEYLKEADQLFEFDLENAD